MKRLFLVSAVIVSGIFSLMATTEPVEVSPKEVLQQISGLVEQLVAISQDLPMQKQQEFQTVLQQLLQIFMALTNMPLMQEELEELIKTKISPAKYTQLQKLQKNLVDKLEKATAPFQKERNVIDKKQQAVTQKILAENAATVKQIEALQAQIQVEVEQYMQTQAALQANADLP